MYNAIAYTCTSSLHVYIHKHVHVHKHVHRYHNSPGTPLGSTPRSNRSHSRTPQPYSIETKRSRSPLNTSSDFINKHPPSPITSVAKVAKETKEEEEEEVPRGIQKVKLPPDPLERKTAVRRRDEVCHMISHMTFSIYMYICISLLHNMCTCTVYIAHKMHMCKCTYAYTCTCTCTSMHLHVQCT